MINNYPTNNLILFLFQIVIIFIVICVSLLNLTCQWGNLDLWIIILTGTLGYLMPNPQLKANDDKSPEQSEN